MHICIYNGAYMACNWDDEKNELNKRQHRISFETAIRVFDDPFHITGEDYIDDNGEVRQQTLGVVDGVLILVAHVYRVIEVDEEPWLIMARKAVKYEEKIYTAHIKNRNY
jgi:uncharacterized DUF497 family protein